MRLDKFFEPNSVAVVGASRTPGKVGHDVVRNLVEAGFQGPIYPVNPQADEILGLKCFPDLPSVAEAAGAPVDLVVIVVPARVVLEVVEQCAEVRSGAVIVISAGFKESGPAGAELEKGLAERCREAGIRCVGPNCLGVISPPHHLNASFSATTVPPGNIAFFSQSGALGTAVLDAFAGEGIGISRFVSYGNKADVDESDLIEALGEDEQTDVILGYVESIDDGQKFMSVTRRVTRKKPVLILKSGRTAAGAKAASSHTGSLAGSDAAYEAAFKQCGVIRARSVTEFFDYVLAFSCQEPPRGPRVAIVTNAGGPAILATDAIESTGMRMATLSAETERALSEQLPAGSNVHNPVDVLGDAKADRYRLAIDAVRHDDNVDAILTILTPQTSTEVEGTAETIAEASARTEKPVLASFMGSLTAEKGARLLRQKGVPAYPHPERAVVTLDAMCRFYRWTKTPAEQAPQLALDAEAIRVTLQEARRAGMAALGERHARRIVEACGLRVARSVLAPTEAEAIRAAEQMGYPVVMKISSDDILHKSEAGGVKLDLEDRDEVRTAFREITAGARAYKPDARVDGVLVQEMLQGGTQIIVGFQRDPQFGVLVMFGLGGIYVEALKDVTFRVAPITPRDAREMTEEIKTAEILRGFRGSEPADLDALTDCILRISRLALDFPELAECDINPLLVFGKGKGVAAVDARFALAAP